MRRCHYEVLGVERDANEADLKKVYRRLALKWHPDKNPDDTEECTKVFAEIQQAYDVLSDPQERAWYDKHREQILRGGDDYVDNSINLMKYFSASVYSGYGDDENGFYAVYSRVFKTIVEEDAEFMAGREEVSADEIPMFGTSESNYEEVVEPFYAFWQSYCTYKSYVWVEKYDIRQAPDRRTQRMAEKENKKLRDSAKKERNEEVRELVKFVRKRDKRVQAYAVVLKKKDEERKKMTEKKRLETKRAREKMLDEYKEQSWASLSGLEEDLDEMNRHIDGEFGGDATGSQSEEEPVEHYYCVACDKAFKSQKTLVNHEKSRKHKENAELVRREMEQNETQEIGANPESLPDDITAIADSEIEEKFLNRRMSSFDEDGSSGQSDFVSVGELELRDSVELSTLRIKGGKRFKVKDRHGKPRSLSGIGEEVLEILETSSEESESDRENESEKPSHGGNSPENQTDATNSVPELVKDVDRCLKTGDGETDSVEGDSAPSVVETAEQSSASVVKNGGPSTDAGEWTCNVCQGAFPTRNELFQHIKKQGHALRVEENNVQEKKKAQSKKEGKKKR